MLSLELGAEFRAGEWGLKAGAELRLELGLRLERGLSYSCG